MKNFVSCEISENISCANRLLKKLNETLDILEEENKQLKDTFDNLVSINGSDYGAVYGELGDKQYAYSA